MDAAHAESYPLHNDAVPYNCHAKSANPAKSVIPCDPHKCHGIPYLSAMATPISTYSTSSVLWLEIFVASDFDKKPEQQSIMSSIITCNF